MNRTENGTDFVSPAHCVDCGAKLSRYREPGATRCATCSTRHADHADAERARERGICQRGHDLEQHGVIVRTEGDRYSRKCGACIRIRATEYQKRRRARRRAIRDGQIAPPLESVGDQARARYARETVDMLRLRDAGVSITDIARRVGARPNTISARLARATRRKAEA